MQTQAGDEKNFHICQAVLLLLLNTAPNSCSLIRKKDWSSILVIASERQKRERREGSTHNMKKTHQELPESEPHAPNRNQTVSQDWESYRDTCDLMGGWMAT